jgi:asparagine synthase (glutamine-hydrolysing)
MRLDRVRAAAGPLARSIGSLAQFSGDIIGDERLQRYGYALGRPLAEHYFSRTSSPAAFFNRHAKTFFTRDFLKSTASEDSPVKQVNELLGALNGEPLLNRMLYVDSKTWLPDDLLVKADKMTMANSLELRVPLLDHKVLEFAASLPPEFKVSGKQTKRVLKAAFAKALPSEILNRKKAGFPVPYGKWLRNGLGHDVKDVLLSSDSIQRAYFEKGEVNRLLEADSRTGNHSKEIFSLLVLELWHRRFLDADNSVSGATETNAIAVTNFSTAGAIAR